MSLLLTMAISAFAGISGSPHDLGSGNTTNSWASSTQDQICIFCHTPHNAQIGTDKAPLWNKAASPGPYSMYTSASFNGGSATMGPQSAACMACHDGSFNVDAYVYSWSDGGSAGTAGLTGFNADIASNDLKDDHPIGFTYATSSAADADIKPAPTSTLPLFGGQMECATCHNVHLYGNTGVGGTAPFLRLTQSTSVLCLTCHNK